MSGKDALADISTAERCSESEAIRQLQAAISDGQVGARLPDPKSSRRSTVFPPGAEHSIFAGFGPGASSMTSVGIRQIPRPKRWRTAEIRADGTVNFFGEGSPWYAFEVLRENVERIWPLGQRSTIAKERRAREWLKRRLLELGVKGVKTMSKAALREYAIEQFGIKRRGFDERVWPQALAEISIEISNAASRAGRKSAR
jgi:hypothetical protein